MPPQSNENVQLPSPIGMKQDGVSAFFVNYRRLSMTSSRMTSVCRSDGIWVTALIAKSSWPLFARPYRYADSILPLPCRRKSGPECAREFWTQPNPNSELLNMVLAAGPAFQQDVTVAVEKQD